MKTEVVFWFWGQRIPGGPRTILEPLGIGPDAVVIDEATVQRVHHVSVTITMPENDARLPDLRALLTQHGVDWSESRHDRYTADELDNARLLWLSPTSDCEVDGGSEFGTMYDLSAACPRCGAGARQTSPLFFDGNEDQVSKLKGHRAGRTYRDEVFIDELLAVEIDALAPKGLLLHQVYALQPDKRQAKILWKQLSAERILPPMSPLTTGIDRPYPCPICPRSGYWDGVPTPRIVYRARDLEDAGDVNITWEEKYEGVIMGNPREWRVPTPWLLVTPKVMRVFRAAGITEFEWVPIRVVDE